MLAKSIVSSSILLLLVPNFASAAFTWIDDKKDAGFNCMGTVADAVCCKDSFCNANSEADCSKGTKQFLCSWTGTKCIPFRDDANNVCCQSEVKDACSKIVKGICPDNWQVPENCCSDLGKKWNGTLIGVKPGHVCCNAPCTEMQKAGCQLPDTCAPSQRSYGYNNPYNMLGFNYLATRPPKSVVLGNVLSGTGFGGDYATSLLDSVGSGKSKDQNVPEITVDDLMSLLIESLSDDKDAMVYNAEMNSDPYMGKTKSGGPVTSMNLPDPNIFLNMLYGSPFGASQGSLGDYPSAYDAYNPYSYMGMPSMTQQYPPQYPGMMPPQAYPQYPGMPQPFASQPPYQQINPYQPYQSPPPQQWQQPAPQPQWQQPAPQPQWQQPAPQPQWQQPSPQPQWQQPAPQPAPQPQWQQPAPQPAPQPQWQQPTPAPQPQWQQPTPAPQPVPVAQPQPAPAPQPQPAPAPQPQQPTPQPTQAPPQPTQAPKSQQPWPQPAPQQQPAQQPWPPAQQPAQQPWPPAQQPWQQPAPPQQPGPIFKGQP